jgi:hypothetical protein
MYSVFLNLQTLEYYITSKNSLDYNDYVLMPSHYKEVHSGTKASCQEYTDINETEYA